MIRVRELSESSGIRKSKANSDRASAQASFTQSSSDSCSSQ
jgi:hypothetical protein